MPRSRRLPDRSDRSVVKVCRFLKILKSLIITALNAVTLSRNGALNYPRYLDTSRHYSISYFLPNRVNLRCIFRSRNRHTFYFTLDHTKLKSRIVLRTPNGVHLNFLDVSDVFIVSFPYTRIRNSHWILRSRSHGLIFINFAASL